MDPTKVVPAYRLTVSRIDLVLKISLHLINYPTNGEGSRGLVVPHSRTCYIAPQIQQLGGWGLLEPLDSVRNMLIPEDSAYSVLAHLEEGFPNLPSDSPTVLLLNTLWKYTKTILNVTGFLSCTLL